MVFVFGLITWALFGAVFGSFMTVVAYRVPRGESIVKPRSRCPGCGTEILSRDNIPVVSWAMRRGQCRSCGEKISARYPIQELACAGLFALAGGVFRDNLAIAVVMAAFFWVLLCVSVVDIELMIIPNKIIVPALGVAAALIVAGWAAGVPVSPIEGLIGMVAWGGFLFAIFWFFPQGMGAGDFKLSAFIGLVLGSLGLPYVAVAAAAGIFLGGFVAVGVLLVNGGKGKVLPFGPALAGGAVLAAAFAPQVWDWYRAGLG